MAEMTPLAQWLWGELQRRKESAREASLGAGLSHASIHRFLAGRRPSPDSCRKLARYFQVPEEFVLQLAGHISPPPDQDIFLRQMDQVTRDWSEADRRTLVEVARAIDRQRSADSKSEED